MRYIMHEVFGSIVSSSVAIGRYARSRKGKKGIHVRE
jgi:hypothetical protein